MRRPYGHLGLAMLALASMMFGGCGSDANNLKCSLSVDEDGSLTQTIIDTPDEGMSEEDLESYINQQISERQESGKISLDSCKVSSKEVKIVLTYNSCEDYEAFNNMECFVGTIKEAEAAGYNFDATMVDKKGETADKTVISERKDEWKVLIVEEPMNVKVYDKVLYTTENAEITGRLSAAVNADAEEDADQSVEDQTVSSSSGDVEPVEGAEDTSMEDQISQMTEQNVERAYIIFK